MVWDRRFADRVQAGRQLAQDLVTAGEHAPGLLVLGLPRGGVVVAAEVASRLDGELDALAVRKVRLAYHPELALGAVASGGLVVRNEDVLADLRVSDEQFAEAVEQAQQELERGEARWRPPDRPPPVLTGRRVILVDDGIATGATIRAAAVAARAAQAARVVIAAPAAPSSSIRSLRRNADVVVVSLTPGYFGAVSRFYADFREVTDAEVRALLTAGARSG